MSQALHNVSYTDNSKADKSLSILLCYMLFLSLALPNYLDISLIDKIISSLLFFSLSSIIFTDSHCGYIYDRFNLLIGGLAILKLALLWNYDNIISSVLGLFIGGGFLLFIDSFSLLIFKRNGVGRGDIKFAFACGFLLGYPFILHVFVLTFLPAFCYCLLTSQKDYLPLGPFLCTATWLVYCLGLI